MDLNERRRARLVELLADLPASTLARKTQIAASTLSRYKSDPATNGHKNISEENARKIEIAAKKPIYWLDGESKPPGKGVAQAMSLDGITVVPKIEWEQLMSSELPTCFKVALPDNAMAPRAVAGAEIEFTRGIAPVGGDGILVRDRAGNYYFRLYTVRGVAWEARAVNAAFLPLEPERDGLEVIGVLTATPGRWA